MPPGSTPAVASETTFVAMIARRRLIDRGRSSAPGPRPGHSPTASPRTPLPEPIERAEDVARAAEALGRLRDEQRRVLGLSLRDGLTYDQIARATGLPLGTVKTHARRGLIRLRELLGSAPTAGDRPMTTDRDVDDPSLDRPADAALERGDEAGDGSLALAAASACAGPGGRRRDRADPGPAPRRLEADAGRHFRRPAPVLDGLEGRRVRRLARGGRLVAGDGDPAEGRDPAAPTVDRPRPSRAAGWPT